MFKFILSVRATCVGIALFSLISAHAEDYVFARYHLTHRGSPRAIALSGATLALPNNPAAYTENPSAVPFQAGILSLSVLSGSTEAKQPDIANVTVDENSFLSAGVNVLVQDTFGLSGGYEAEAYETRMNETSASQLGVAYQGSEIPIGLSARLFDQLTLGVSYIPLQYKVTRSRGERGANLKEVAGVEFGGGAFRVSSVYAFSPNISFAAAYRLDAVAEQTSNTGVSQKAQKFYAPARFQAGMAYFLQGPESLASTNFPLDNTFSVQLDTVHFPSLARNEKAFDPIALILETDPKATELSAETRKNENAQYDTSGMKFIPKFGVETALFREKSFSFSTWLGTYYEPGLFVADDGRSHVTAGAEVTAWFLIVRYGVDMAKDYSNQGLGVGVGFTY